MSLTHGQKTAILATHGYKQASAVWRRASAANPGCSWEVDPANDTATLVDCYGREQDCFIVDWARFQ
jgi:hypothetical protein